MNSNKIKTMPEIKPYKKITAVEWLEKKFSDNEFDDCFYLATNQKWFEQAKEMEKKQTEISDEEIEKFADEELGTIRTDFDFGVVQGMKWYREQLKKKQ
jgi:hypothetical protein